MWHNSFFIIYSCLALPFLSPTFSYPQPLHSPWTSWGNYLLFLYGMSFLLFSPDCCLFYLQDSAQACSPCEAILDPVLNHIPFLRELQSCVFIFHLFPQPVGSLRTVMKEGNSFAGAFENNICCDVCGPKDSSHCAVCEPVQE